MECARVRKERRAPAATSPPPDRAVRPDNLVAPHPAACFAGRNEPGRKRVRDLVIENARIVDGLGGPARQASLAVEDGRIAAIGDGLGAAKQRIDAAGLVLAPGIIDIHTHFDAQLTWDPYATPSN